MNQRFEVYGPEALTIRAALESYLNLSLRAVNVSQTPFWVMKLMNRMFMRGNLTHVIELMELTETIGETGSSAHTSQVLGTPSTTLKQWFLGDVAQPMP